MTKKKTHLFNFLFRLKNYFNEHFFNYPSLFIYYPFCSKILNNIRIKFWLILLRKNNNFYKFFYENDLLKLDDILNELRQSGIVVIPNFLPKNIYDEFLVKTNNSDQYVDYKVSESTDAKLFRSPLREYPYFYDFINSCVTKIYGKVLSGLNFDVIKTRCRFVPEIHKPGNNIIHSDRLTPSIKFVYAPFGVKTNEAPFAYYKGSEKFILKNLDECLLHYSNRTEVSFFEDIKHNFERLELVCPPNTLAIFMTHGLHERTSFIEPNERTMCFIQLYEAHNIKQIINDSINIKKIIF